MTTLRPVSTNLINCSCGGLNLIGQYENVDRVTRFLRGMLDNYSAIRSQIMMIKPLLQITKFFSIFLQQEREIMFISSNIEPVVLFNQSTQSFGHGGGRPGHGRGRFTFYNKKPHCTFCGKHNHTVDTCYRKNGFPIGYSGSGSNTSFGGSIN